MSPYIAQDGVRIHYEVAGLEGGPPSVPVVLLHPVYASMTFFRRAPRGGSSYVDRLGDRYRLLLIDARGHGESDQPTTVEAYDFRTRVLDVVTVLDALEVPSAHLFGYSMGAHIGMSAAIYAPQRFRSLFLGGASPYGAADFSMTQRPWPETWPFLERLPHAHFEAWRALSESQWAFRGAAQALRTTSLPLMLFAGERDPGPYRGVTRFASERGARPPGLRHFIVPGAAHIEAARVDAVAPHLDAFLAEIGATGH